MYVYGACKQCSRYVVETGEYGTHGNGSAASGDPQPDSIRRGYHTNRECTHIRLSVRVVEATEALREYRPCEKCTDKIPDPTGGLLLFVSENGECYHSRRDCPGLKRTVQKIPKGEAFKYEVCSRCRGNNSKDR